MNTENKNNHKTPPISERDQEFAHYEAQLRPIEGWQPIETAPDHEPVLVWVVNGKHGTKTHRVGYKDANEDKSFVSWIDGAGCAIEIFDYRITHWMPLPDPPK